MEHGSDYAVRVERNVLIPVNGGISLAADLFVPEGPGPFPALVVYFPYHKDDYIGGLFDHPNRYFASRGYASLLVDLRGLGNSEGIAWDQGDNREGADGASIVEWAAAQPWCDGSVGMWGMSYPAIMSLSTASIRPPHLKAIVAMMGGLDPYHDIFYPGGCFTCLGMLGAWGTEMTAMNVAPPMYHDAHGRWARVWRSRLEQPRQPYVLPHRAHAEFDSYWQSKVIDANRIEVPTFLVGAWRDIFPDAVVRAYEHISAPRRILMGPWMHEMPDLAGSSQVDYLAEMVRWWDRWLKGVDNGVSEEPPVILYVQGVGWRAETAWPIERTRWLTLYLTEAEGAEGVLADVVTSDTSHVTYRADPTVGVTAGLWDPTGTGVGAPLDQGPDDLRSITFTGDPLEDGLEITGRPEAILHVALDEGDDVNLVVKLCDVAPDGHSALITTGWLKGSHRLSDEQPQILERGRVLEFHIPLWATSYHIPSDHRLRVSIACADFPRIWPTRTNPLIRLATGGSQLSAIRLPMIPHATAPDCRLPVPDPSVDRMPFQVEVKPRWKIEHDLATGSVVVSAGIREAVLTPSRDGSFVIDRLGRAGINADRPDSAYVEGEATITLRTPSGSDVVSRGRMRVTLNDQDIAARVTVDGQTIFDQRWRG